MKNCSPRFEYPLRSLLETLAPGGRLTMTGSRSFLQTMGWTTGLRIIGLPLQFLVFVLVARCFRLEDVGIYALANAIWQAFKGLGPLGLDVAALRFGPALEATGKIAAVQSLERGSRRVVLVGGVVSAILVFAALWIFASRLRLPLELAVLIAVGVPVFSLLGLQVNQLRARNMIRAAQLPESILLSALTGVLIVISQIAHATSIAWALLATIVAAVAILLMNQGRFRKLYIAEAAPLDRQTRSEVARSAAQLFTGQALISLMARMSPIAITMFLGQGATALYEAATRLGQLASVSTWAAGVAAAPMMATAHAEGNRERFQRIITVSSWCAFLPAATITLITWMAGKQLLLLFGTQYVVGYPVAVLVSVATTINAAGGLSSTAFYMAGKERVIIWLTLAGVVMLAAGLVIMLPWVGLLGSGIALIAASAVRDGGASALLRSQLGSVPGVLSFHGPMQMIQLLNQRFRLSRQGRA